MEFEFVVLEKNIKISLAKNITLQWIKTASISIETVHLTKLPDAHTSQ